MSYQTNYYKSGEPYHSFRCSSYGNRTVNCTIHHISDKVLYQLVLRSIQRLSSHIIADERGFAEELKSKWEAKANGKPQKQKEELQTINRRLNELDRLIGSLYENFIACIIFSLFAASPPAVDPNAAAVSMVWSYIGELVFNMLVLVGAVKMADRVVREMMGL